MTSKTLIVVDRDPRRRASLSFDLLDASFHAEPCESLGEYEPRLPDLATILVHDEGDLLSRTMDFLRQHGIWLPVIAYRVNPQPGQVVDALNLGAIDYVVWPIDVSDLSARIESYRERFAAHFALRTREMRAQRKLKELTKRELEVMKGIIDGNTNRMIAEELKISPKTVDIHRGNAISKIGAKNTAEAVRITVEGISASGEGAIFSSS
jgi:FixJ family two-component response regulator